MYVEVDPMQQQAIRWKRFPVVLSLTFFLIVACVLVVLPGGAHRLPTTSPSGVDALALNPFQIATLHWYTIRSTNFSTGQFPEQLVFDGASMWVSYQGNQNSGLSKLRASDGLKLGDFHVGALAPTAAVFDGSHIWVTDGFTGSIAKVRASDGVVLNFYNQITSNGSLLYAAFDGASLWLADENNNQLLQLRPSDGTVLARYSFVSGALAFDGVNLAGGDGVVNVIKISDGVVVNSANIGGSPSGIVFDGSAMWISDYNNGLVTKMRDSDLAVLSVFAVSHPNGMAYDGANIWISSGNENTVTKMAVSDGTVLGTFTTGSGASAVAFDGANIWVANDAVNSVSKF